MIKKIAILAILIILVFVSNILISTGFFRNVENKFSGEIIKKIPLTGTEDITISSIDSFALISSTNRSCYPPKEEEHGGIYFMDFKTGKFVIKQISSSFKKPFAPHGISMLKTGDHYTVSVINHTPTGSTIEFFKLLGDSLIHVKTLKNPSILSPNDLVLIDEDRFYFTNDHGYIKGVGKFMEEYLGLSLSNVVYFDGKSFTEVAGDIAYANGINFDTKRNIIYVASPRKFLVKVYSKNPNGSLEFIENIPCGMGVDNIELNNQGHLLIGGHPNLLRFKSYAKGNEKTSPSEIIKVNYIGKNNFTVDNVYTEDGSVMSASTVAAPFGDLILTGNLMDNKFLILKTKN